MKTYFLTCQRRLAQREGLVMRHSPWVLAAGVIVIGSVASFVLHRGEDWDIGLKLVAVAFIAFALGSGLSFIQSLAGFVRGSLSFCGTSDAPGSAALPQMDAELSVLPFSDKEILEAALRMLLPPVMLPALLVNLAFMLFFHSSYIPSQGASEAPLSSYVLMALVSCICSLLAIPLCALYFISLGGRLSQLSIMLASRVFVLLQVIWLPIVVLINQLFANSGWLYYSDYDGGHAPRPDPFLFGMLLAGMLLAAGAICLLPLYASGRLRPILAIAGPLLPALMLFGGFVVWAAIEQSSGQLHFSQALELYQRMQLGFSVMQGGLFPLSPVTFSTVMDLGYRSWKMDTIAELDPSFCVRAIAIPLLQLAMLPILWQAALRNIRRMRQAQD